MQIHCAKYCAYTIQFNSHLKSKEEDEYCVLWIGMMMLTVLTFISLLSFLSRLFKIKDRVYIYFWAKH